MWKEPDCEARLFHFLNLELLLQSVIVLLFSFGNVDFVFTE